MNTGWVKLHRSLLDWEWYGDHNTTRLFVHLLLTANHKETRFCGHTVPRGARVAGRVKLAEETGLSEQELRTALTRLKSTGEITSKSTNRFSIVTVCNYDKYQTTETTEQPANQPAGQPTSNQQATTSKEVKKLRSKETTYAQSADENAPFAEFWKAYPRKKSKVDAQKAWKQVKGDTIFNEIMTGLQQATASPDWAKKGGKFIPYPASWLRAGGWMDEAGIAAQEEEQAHTCKSCRHNRPGGCDSPGTLCEDWAGRI